MSGSEIHYRSLALARGHYPGAHRSRGGPSGIEFRSHALLQDAPDARRLDLHASLRDPLGQWWVRVHAERKSMPVAIVADLSASMGFAGTRRKQDVLADFTACLAASVWRHGDRFGFVGCDTVVRADLRLPPTRARGLGAALADTVRRLALVGASAQGLLDAHLHLGRQRALVFLVSDFHLPLPMLAQLLRQLAAHEVVPVVVWDPAEFALGGARGLAAVIDPESGAQRLVWWRPALRDRWAARQAERREALLAAFRREQLRPLLMANGFDADAVTRHFHS